MYLGSAWVSLIYFVGNWIALSPGTLNSRIHQLIHKYNLNFILEDAVKIVSESIIKSNTGKTFVVKKGQIIRVIGESTADYVVFNLRDVKERFDQARTKVDQGKIYVTTGDVLISKYNNVMQTIVKDTYR